MDGYEAIKLFGYDAIKLSVAHGPWTMSLVDFRKYFLFSPRPHITAFILAEDPWDSVAFHICGPDGGQQPKPNQMELSRWWNFRIDDFRCLFAWWPPLVFQMSAVCIIGVGVRSVFSNFHRSCYPKRRRSHSYFRHSPTPTFLHVYLKFPPLPQPTSPIPPLPPTRLNPFYQLPPPPETSVLNGCPHRQEGIRTNDGTNNHGHHSQI